MLIFAKRKHLRALKKSWQEVVGGEAVNLG